MIDHGKITSWITGDGLYDAELLGLSMDDRNRLWMACSRGIFWVDRAELVRFAQEKIDRVHSTTYSPTEALRVVEGRQGVQPALWRMRNGQLWLSTARGLLALDPDPRNVNAPPVVIEDPSVNGQVIAPALISRLPAGQKNIQFNFAGLSYIQPELIRYRYRLEGQDAAWIDAGTRREASYTNLPPGGYKFHVTACNPGAICNGNEASIEFTVTPRFYQRVWFWPVVVVLLGALAWGAYQLHIRQLHARYDLILSERSRIARELHDTLIQGFSGITMALQGLTARIHSPAERETLEDIIHDAATCLRETRQSVAGLRAVHDSVGGPQEGLASSIRDAVRELTETKPIRVKLNLEPVAAKLVPEVEYNLLRIVREAVNNSVKHSGAGEIEVKLSSATEALNISIHDDGSGFNRDDAAAPGPGHYGIIGMKERATQIGATLEVATRPGEGTTISLTLPLSIPADRHVEVSK
jgi:signal transduction histidine kinase